MCGVYVTNVVDAEKGQRHVVTLVWSFRIGLYRQSKCKHCAK